MQEPETTMPASCEWLTYAEARHVTGLGRTKLWELCSSGEIRAARVGRTVRINRESLEAYTERNRYARGWR
jgi:excisionase family DNA binding protein